MDIPDYDTVNYFITNDIIIYDVFYIDKKIFVLANKPDEYILVKINSISLNRISIKQCFGQTSIIIYDNLPEISSDVISIDIEYNNSYHKNIVLKSKEKQILAKEITLYSSLMFANDPGIGVLDAWIKHQTYLGVDKFFLYYNSSDIKNIKMLTEDMSDNVKFIFWNYPNNLSVKDLSRKEDTNYQVASMMHCLYKYAKDEATWMMSLDLDEFIVPIQHKSIKDVIRSFPHDTDYINMRGYASRLIDYDKMRVYPALTGSEVKFEDIRSIKARTSLDNKNSFNYKYIHKCEISETLDVHMRSNPTIEDLTVFHDQDITYLHFYNFSRFPGRAGSKPSESDIEDLSWNQLYN